MAWPGLKWLTIMVFWWQLLALCSFFTEMQPLHKRSSASFTLSNVALMWRLSWFLCKKHSWGRTLCIKMGEGCFGSIQLINNFVSVHTPLWGKFDLDSAPKGSWSQHDFEAFGHKEIALYKKFTVAPSLVSCGRKPYMGLTHDHSSHFWSYSHSHENQALALATARFSWEWLYVKND